jgi:UDP-N-acetylglucosamine 2-epimerase (non-hydrolysing)
MNARFLLTDSGGVQEESTFFGIPCLTLRKNTERPVTVTQGTNILVGTDPARIFKESLNILSGNGKRGEVPELWDEGVVQRIVEAL